MGADLLLALLFSLPALPRYAEFQAQSRLLEETRGACKELERNVEKRGEEIDRLLKAGQREQARVLLRKTHEASEALTDCRRRQKVLERSVRDLIPEARREVDLELDRWLGAGLSRTETYARIQPLLQIFDSLGPPVGCPLPTYDEVEFAPGEPPSVLEEKRLVARDILRRIETQKADGETRIRELEREAGLRRQLAHFLSGLEVEGGTRLYEVQSADAESREHLSRVEEELRQCRRALQLAETLGGHWEERIAALDRLLDEARPGP